MNILVKLAKRKCTCFISFTVSFMSSDCVSRPRASLIFDIGSDAIESIT